MANIKKEYERWLANATADTDVAAELKTLDDAKKIEDACLVVGDAELIKVRC